MRVVLQAKKQDKRVTQSPTEYIFKLILNLSWRKGIWMKHKGLWDMILEDMGVFGTYIKKESPRMNINTVSTNQNIAMSLVAQHRATESK